MVIVIASSLTAGRVLRFPPDGLSFRWYYAAASDDAFMSAFWVSTQLATIATIVSLVIGLSASFALARRDIPGKTLLLGAALSPLVVPMVVIGLGLLQALVCLRLNQSMLGLILGHVLITLPYVVRTLLSGLVHFDQNLEFAAMNLRAPPLRVLTRITLPILAPTMMSAAVFAFVTSFGNITLSIFLGYGGQATLPVQIFTYVEQSFEPIIAAVSSLVVFGTVGLLLVVEWLFGMSKTV
ncbi:ABC transporter permease [Bradyrhizobium liaoningense]|uniref:ABC transporter permease n=1 Tax=Bradyrhizobium liaoningense TaxID=43992 RepID=UPI001BABFF6F